VHGRQPSYVSYSYVTWLLGTSCDMGNNSVALSNTTHKKGIMRDRLILDDMALYIIIKSSRLNRVLSANLFRWFAIAMLVECHMPLSLSDCSWLIHTNTSQLPVVLFTKRPHAPAQELAPLRIIGPVTFTYKTTVKQRAGLPHAPVEMVRTMLPLRLAWALTVHRSQVSEASCRREGREEAV